ncbi:hypothetical protein MPSEU_000202200 [Mayamaea pseudoterrestris]|nr:hypothetical protein MPSEU_000202200 [Mayamaea pseudoterrestris]
MISRPWLILLQAILYMPCSSAFVSRDASSWRSFFNSNRRQSIARSNMAVSEGKRINELIAEPSYASLLTSKSFDGTSSPALLNFTLHQHRPLGCTIEESLAACDERSGSMADNVMPFVFVSKVQPQGYAHQAGLQVGDVIVGTSGLFGDVIDVTRAGMNKIRGLISACPDEDPLQLQIVRGTNVLENHEAALVQLCSQVSSTNDEVDSCLLDYLKAGYDTNFDDNADSIPSTAMVDNDGNFFDCNDADTECLLDSMHGFWAENTAPLIIPQSGAPELVSGPAAAAEKQVVKPWSSRSSPSGTFVRDPSTGVMRNLDA